MAFGVIEMSASVTSNSVSPPAAATVLPPELLVLLAANAMPTTPRIKATMPMMKVTTHQPSPLRCSCSDMTPPFEIFRALVSKYSRRRSGRQGRRSRGSTLECMPIHIRAEASDYAPAVLVPGDPRRAKYIAETFFDPGFRLVNEERGALGFTGTFQGKPISVQSVGMGCASAGIYYNELIQLGATRIIRVGTAGGLAPNLRLADTVVAISATADDPVVGQLTQGEAHSPTASWTLVESAVNRARELGARVHVGPIVSAGLFYDPRQGIMQRWADRGHLAVEMEAAMLYTLGAMHKIETLTLATISDLIVDEQNAERISDEDMKIGVDRMMQIACDVAVS